MAITVEVEERAFHETIEEDDVEIKAIRVVEVVEVSDEERIVVIGGVVEITGGDEPITVVEEIDILGDNGVRVVVDSVELADGGGVVKTVEKALAGDVEHTEDVVGSDAVVVVAGEAFIITTIVEAIDVRGDDGKLVVVNVIELVDKGEIVRVGDEIVANEVEDAEDIVEDELAEVILVKGVVAMASKGHTEVVEREPRDVVDLSNLIGGVELGDVKLVLDVVVVANVIVEQEDNGVDVTIAIVDDNGVVDAVVRAVVQVAGIVRPVLVIGGVVVNFVE